MWRGDVDDVWPDETLGRRRLLEEEIVNPLDDDAARASIIAASMVDAGNWLIVAMFVRQGINVCTSDGAMSGAFAAEAKKSGDEASEFLRRISTQTPSHSKEQKELLLLLLRM